MPAGAMTTISKLYESASRKRAQLTEGSPADTSLRVLAKKRDIRPSLFMEFLASKIASGWLARPANRNLLGAGQSFGAP
jgi:hypothetical protein